MMHNIQISNRFIQEQSNIVNDPIAATVSHINIIFFLLRLSATAPPNKLISRYGIKLQIASNEDEITRPVVLYAHMVIAKLVMAEPNCDMV